MKEHAALIIKNNNKEILFVKRSIKKKTLPGTWSFPSGTIEPDEKVYGTCIREAKEELNVDIKPEQILADKELPEFGVKLIFVVCDIINGIPEITEPDEIDEIKWMSFEDFFNNFSDEQIGHGLVWLRKNQDVLKSLIL